MFVALPLAWISPDYFESLLLPQLRGENDSKQSDEFQATLPLNSKKYSFLMSTDEIIFDFFPSLALVHKPCCLMGFLLILKELR